jgi:hypothetical protein
MKPSYEELEQEIEDLKEGYYFLLDVVRNLLPTLTTVEDEPEEENLLPYQDKDEKDKFLKDIALIVEVLEE